MVYRPTARVLAVLALLQAYGQLSGVELARRLEVDVRTVRRYVTTLQDLGVPVESELGRAGGYTLRPGYKLPPLMFTDDEVLVVTLGLLAVRRSGLAGAGTAVESALAKIDRVLPFPLRDRLRALSETVDADEGPDALPVDPSLLAVLSAASRDARQVHLLYGEGANATERVFDPYAVIRYDHRWYAVGYCHLRQAMRTFRLDRTRVVELLPTTFTPPVDFDALAYLFASFEAIPDRWDIEVWLALPIEEARRRTPRGMATLTQQGQLVRMRASMRDLDEFARLLISYGCDVVIVQPDELRDAFLELAASIQRMASITAAAIP